MECVRLIVYFLNQVQIKYHIIDLFITGYQVFLVTNLKTNNVRTYNIKFQALKEAFG